ncbi:MAG TPA: hypothetical protein VIM16_00435 [Mucilaginibacter sp.]|jgi:quinol monooxygenase YgiN
MATIVARHKVGDFATWLKGHEERARLLAPAISSFQTFQDTDDPNSIVLVGEVKDMGKLDEIMNSKESLEAQDRHTVLRPIIVSMQVPI